MEKLLNISGGATKITGLLASAKAVTTICDYKPTSITGVSSGAILGLIVAMQKFEQAEKLFANLKLSTFMSSSPVNSKGKLTLKAYWRLLTGKKSLGVQDIASVVSQIITKEVFLDYIDPRKTYADVYILAVDAKTGKEKCWNVKHLSYEIYLQVVAASCAIPVFTQPIKVNDNYYFDGGLRNHSGGAWAVRNLTKAISKSVSIYSRPAEEEYKIATEGIDSVIKVLSTMISIFNVDVSLNDETVEKLYCSAMDIKQVSIHLPILTKNLYDVDKKTLQKLAILAHQETLSQWQLQH